jgi:hypothetical protein
LGPSLEDIHYKRLLPRRMPPFGGQKACARHIAPKSEAAHYGMTAMARQTLALA